MTSGERPAKSGLSPKAEEHGRNFVAALFMAARTAQIHQPTNQAFENAIRALHSAADDLFAVLGPFSIKFVDQSVYLNRVRLRFDGGGMATLRVLRAILAAQGLGGVELVVPPSYATIRKLVLLFAGSASDRTARDELAGGELALLGPQAIGDQERNLRVESSAFAVQGYAKLILALREQYARIGDENASADASIPQLRAVRIVQDLIEVGTKRPDLLVMLATTIRGAAPHELRGANACLISMVMGLALGLSRADLVDIAMGALFHMLGAPMRTESQRNTLTRDDSRSALARVLPQCTVGMSSYRRALVIAELRLPAMGHAPAQDARGEGARREPHPFARLAGVAVAFVELMGGYGVDPSTQLSVADAVSVLAGDHTGRFDPGMVDVLINVLRAFPAGTEVVLDTGERAVVSAPGVRLDQPRVTILGATPRELDLADPRSGRTIAGTATWAGVPPVLQGNFLRELAPEAPPFEEVPAMLASGDLMVIPSSDSWPRLPARKMPSFDLTFEPPEEMVPPPPPFLSNTFASGFGFDVPTPPPPPRSPPPLTMPEDVVETPASEMLMPGTVLGDRYRVLTLLGEGGMATVYRVEHMLLLKHMALKLLKAELSLLPHLAERFLREARAVCQLDDPNIVRVTDFGRAPNGGLFLVMELLDGVSLAEMIRRGGRMPITEIIDIIDQVLAGLAHAHDNQIIHRDIKPDNIMLIARGPSKLVKVLDFGIAKLDRDAGSGEGKSLTRPGTVFGTLSYMSPEQAIGEPVDMRSDLYSVGVMLYELLSGHVPFQDESALKVIARTITQPPPRIDLSAYPPDLAAAIERVVYRALQKEPGDRFPSANAFRNELRACLELAR